MKIDVMGVLFDNLSKEEFIALGQHRALRGSGMK